MKPVEIKDLVLGVMTVIGIAMAIGQYSNLQRFARQEFARSLTMQGWHQNTFFEKAQGSRHHKQCTAPTWKATDMLSMKAGVS